MGKVVKAVSPFITTTGSNFKAKPFESWKLLGGMTSKSHYPCRIFNKIAHEFALPSMFKSGKEARLRFVEAAYLNYQTFPDYAFHEVIPFVWDCWPMYDKKVVAWFVEHDVKSCIFTSSQAADRIQKCLPNLNILVVTEGIDTECYNEGLELCKRDYDVYYFGRAPKAVYKKGTLSGLAFKWGGSDEEFHYRIENSKVTNAFPQCDANHEKTGGQETLTQRFWECMLSRIVMIGRAPKELIDLVGYDPVIPLDVPLDSNRNDISEAYRQQLLGVLSNISVYQELVDKNRETALRMAPWEIRMKQVMEWLTSLGYEV